MTEETPGFEKELETLLNKHSQEQFSNTPDYVLARYLLNCLRAFNWAIKERERWHERVTRNPD